MNSEPNLQRIHKVIAASGITSRRKAEELIQQGRVTVNGEIVTTLGVKVGDADVITVDGQAIRRALEMQYLVMNKPKGYVTTMDDPQRRQTIMQLLPDTGAVLKPVGRLDMDTEGLLLCTNDGDLAARLAHPRYGIEKEYEAALKGEITDDAIKRLERGVFIDGERTHPAKVEVISRGDGRSVVRITIHEGRNRQVRRMTECVGYPVNKLRRVRYGPIVLRRLPPGGSRMLSVPEIAKLKALVGLK